MSRRQIDIIWLVCSVFCFLMLSVSFLLMPLISEVPIANYSIYTLVAGCMFWVSLILGIITQCVLAHRRKSWYVTHRIRTGRVSRKIGLISFFENAYATVADIVAALSLVAFILVMIVTPRDGYICYVLIALFVFSFSMHCILNGRVYYYIVHQDRLIQMNTKEKVSSSK